MENKYHSLVVLVAVMSLATNSFSQAARLVTSFELNADLAQFKCSAVIPSQSTVNVTDGTKSLKLLFQPNAVVSQATYGLTTPLNGGTSSGITFDVVNTTTNQLPMGFQVKDTAGLAKTITFVVEPLGTARFYFPFAEDPSQFNLAHGLPPRSMYRYRWTRPGGAVGWDATKIASFRWYMKAVTSDTVVHVDNVRIIDQSTYQDRLNQVLDKYGQDTILNWPTKILTDADFAARRASEEVDLAANPRQPNLDQYGANANGPTLAATGFFRTQKYNNKWWFVAPNGHLFWGVGVTTVRADNAAPFTGREYAFQSIPAVGAPLSEFLGPMTPVFGVGATAQTFDFGSANVARKYGTTWQTDWGTQANRRLNSWGVNLCGVGPARAVNSFPYIERLDVAGIYQTINPGWITHEELPDPWDAGFSTAVTAACVLNLADTVNDPLLIGATIEQEPSWVGTGEENGRYGVALAVLRKDSTVSPAKDAMITFLQAKYATIAALNGSWGTAFPSFSVLGAPSSVVSPLAPGVKSDLAEYTYAYAKQYFTVCKQAMRSVDPNHLYMGCQFAHYTPDVLRALGDVASVIVPTYYKYKFLPEDRAVFAAVNLPVMIAEFSFGSPDQGLDAGHTPVQFQGHRANAYRSLMRELIDSNQVIGANYYRYSDQPLTGTIFGEGLNTGIVDIADTPYQYMVDAIRTISGELYTRRAP